MSVASKNLFDLLGNDDGDSDTPSGPVKTVDKNSTRTTKRNVEPVAPSNPAGANAGARRTGPGGNEGAFRDKNTGSSSNQRRTTEELSRGGARGGRGARERGGRGGRFPRDRDDRHTKSAVTGSEKQAAQSWGAAEGEAEQKDEEAGEEIAKSELKEAVIEDAQNLEEAEPEDKSVSYADYLAQQAEKKLALGENLEIRKPNEGTKVDKKWANAKPLAKEEDTDFIAGSAGKAKRERERKEKQILEIDQRYVEPDRPRGGGERRGGRGDGRGRGRGEGRGDFRGGRGEGRGRGGPRGDFRGGDSSRGALRGDFRGGRGGNTGLNPNDESAFPSLGA
jgi:plasminogen activator inhibitor 1 RNA-binding protein